MPFLWLNGWKINMAKSEIEFYLWDSWTKNNIYYFIYSIASKLYLASKECK